MRSAPSACTWTPGCAAATSSCARVDLAIGYRAAGPARPPAARTSPAATSSSAAASPSAQQDTLLFRCEDLELKRGERAALLGPNGAGKSTFVKTLLGQLPPLAGRLRVGASVRLGYLALSPRGSAVRHECMGCPPGESTPHGDRRGARAPWGASCSPATTRSSPSGAQRRPAQPRGPGPPDLRGGQLPGAGRADQPPGHHLAGGAGGSC